MTITFDTNYTEYTNVALEEKPHKVLGYYSDRIFTLMLETIGDELADPIARSFPKKTFSFKKLKKVKKIDINKENLSENLTRYRNKINSKNITDIKNRISHDSTKKIWEEVASLVRCQNDIRLCAMVTINPSDDIDCFRNNPINQSFFKSFQSLYVIKDELPPEMKNTIEACHEWVTEILK